MCFLVFVEISATFSAYSPKLQGASPFKGAQMRVCEGPRTPLGLTCDGSFQCCNH